MSKRKAKPAPKAGVRTVRTRSMGQKRLTSHDLQTWAMETVGPRAAKFKTTKVLVRKSVRRKALLRGFGSVLNIAPVIDSEEVLHRIRGDMTDHEHLSNDALKVYGDVAKCALGFSCTFCNLDEDEHEVGFQKLEKIWEDKIKIINARVRYPAAMQELGMGDISREGSTVMTASSDAEYLEFSGSAKKDVDPLNSGKGENEVNFPRTHRTN